MGLDLNNLITYATPKFVIIRDWRLGVLKYVFMLGVFGKVIVLDILVNCRHLKPHPAVGFGFVDLIPPECAEGDKDCAAKYSEIPDLKYCKRYAGDNPTFTGKNPKIGDFVTKQLPCKYYDENKLVWVPQEMSSMFIPLKSVKSFQKINPDCYDGQPIGSVPGKVGGAKLRLLQERSANNTEERRLKKNFRCPSKYTTDSSEEFFVADIGEFTLEFRHSFESRETGLFGTAANFQGFFAACASNHVKDVRKDCRRMMIPGTSGATVPEDVENLEDPKKVGVPSLGVGPKGGDAIQLKDLLKLTPAAQTYDIKHDILDRMLPSRLMLKDQSMREHGGMLMVEVDYTNFVPQRPGLPVPAFLQFLSAPIKPVTYTYRPFFIPTNVMTRNEVTESTDGKTRIVETWYGLELKMDFTGKMVKFDPTEVIAALTTGLVLLTAATAFVDSVMTMLMPLKGKYNLLKYQTSEDFHDATALSTHAKAGDALASGFPSSDLMLAKLTPDGQPKPGAELTPKELLYMMNSHDIRLNRLDGMCDKADFNGGAEVDARWHAMGNFKADFYKKECGDDKMINFGENCRRTLTAAE